MNIMPNNTVQAGRADRAPRLGAQTSRSARHSTIRPARLVSALPVLATARVRDQHGPLRRKSAVTTVPTAFDAG